MNQQPYDNSIKGIFKEDAEELIPNFLEDASFINVLDIEVLRPPMRSDSAYVILYKDKPAILQMEFQAGEDEEIVHRALVYHAGLVRDYRRPVISIIIYLFRSTTTESPLKMTIGGEEQLIFHFKVITLWTLDAQKYIAKHAVSMYPLLPAMKNADAGLLMQAIDELVERYKHSEARLARHLLWFSVFLRRTDTLSAQDKLKVEDRLNAFEYLLEHDEYVQKQRALGQQIGREEGKVEGKIETAQQILLDLVQKRYPALVALAKQRTATIQNAEAIRTAIGLMIDVSDEASARAILDSLLTAQ